MPLNHNYPYNITKIQPSPSKPEQKIDPHGPYIAGKPTHIPKPQMAVPPQVHKPAPYHPHPQVVHYQNQQE